MFTTCEETVVYQQAELMLKEAKVSCTTIQSGILPIRMLHNWIIFNHKVRCVKLAVAGRLSYFIRHHKWLSIFAFKHPICLSVIFKFHRNRIKI